MICSGGTVVQTCVSPVCHVVNFFFFKQKTAYEMRISDGVQTCALPIYAVCPDEAVVATALATARKLAAKPPSSLKLSKQLMKQAKPDVAAQMAAEGVHFSAQLQSDEAREAMTAFFEKRPPKFN